MSDIVCFAAGERCLNLAERVRFRANREGVDFTLVSARFLRPLDEELLLKMKEKKIVTIEDNVLTGGLGDAISRFYRARGIENRVLSFGFQDRFLPHGSVSELFEEFGLSEEEIFSSILALSKL